MLLKMRKISYREFAHEALISDIEVIVSFKGSYSYYQTGLINNKYFALTKTDDEEIMMLDKIDIEKQIDLEEIKNNIENCIEVKLHFPQWLKNIEKAYLNE